MEVYCFPVKKKKKTSVIVFKSSILLCMNIRIDQKHINWFIRDGRIPITNQ